MNVIRPRACNLTGGTKMTEALTLAQCEEMRSFLRCLVHYSKQTRMTRKGLTRFIWEYVRVATGREWTYKTLRARRNKRMEVVRGA